MDGFNGDPDDAMEVPELTPMDDYDADKAKLRASIQWLLHKAFQDNIPEEYSDPVTENTRGVVILKPVVASGLTSSDLYCKACTSLFKDKTSQWKGHMSVMQTLSKKGVYVVDTRESAITEMVLAQAHPLKLTSHLALIDALMTAYCKELVSIEKVVQAVRRFAPVNASSELPYDVEDALLFWMNKVCSVVQYKLNKAGKPGQNQQDRKIPMLEDLLKDLNDGCCLGVVISFYCPDSLRLHDLALKELVGIADSLYNLQEVIKFCKAYLPRRCLHMTLDDLFYTNENLKPNVLMLIAQLFYMFEIKKADCVRSLPPASSVDANAINNDGRSTPRKATKPPAIPISNVTKKSFQQSSSPDDLQMAGGGSSPDLHTLANNSSTNVPPPRQPLLPRRLGNRSSLLDAEDRDLIHQSVRAWEDKSIPTPSNSETNAGQARGNLKEVTASKDSAASGSTLLSNVSMDSTQQSLDLSECTIDMDDLEMGFRTRGGMRMITRQRQLPHSPYDRDRTPPLNPLVQEPLLAARARPTKENTTNHTKQFESGESNPKKKSPVLPVKPMSLNLKTTNGQKNGVYEDSSGSTTPDDAYQTPSMESVPFIQSSKPEATSSTISPPVKAKNKAFFVNMDQMTVIGSSGSVLDRNKPSAQSFTLHDHVHTPESAVAAGIPVVGSARITDNATRDDIMRSSSESSDAELKKIHADHRDSESKSKVPTFGRPESLLMTDSTRASTSNGPVRATAGPLSPKTSFAELGARRLIDNPSLKTKGPETKPVVKKTTFGALPNQTSWVESAQKHAKPTSPKSDDRLDSSKPVATDLMSIRMRLEERRRQIEMERSRMEVQRNKQRQRVGKQAFMKVVSKSGKPETKVKSGKPETKVKRDQQQQEKSLREVESENTPIRPEDATECEEVLQEDEDTNLGDLDDAASLEARRSRVQEAEPDDAGPAADEKSTRRAWDKKPDRIQLAKEDATSDKKSSSLNITQPADALNVSNNSSHGATRRQENSLQKPVGKVTVAEKSSSPSIIDQLKDEHADRTRKDSKSSSGSDTYNSSLEKLNSSLSELQGEIMKLSLKQEEIKNLHAETIGRTSSSSPVHMSLVQQADVVTSQREASPPRQEKTEVRSAKSASEPDVNVRTSSPVITGQLPQLYAGHQQISSQYGVPQPFVPPQMAYGAPPVYGGVNVSGGGYMPMHPHYSAMPQYQPPPMYQQPYQGQMAPPAGYGYPPQGQYQPMPFSQPPETQPFQPAATYTVNGRQVSPQSPITSPVSEVPVTYHTAGSQPQSPQSPHAPNIASPVGVSSPTLLSPQHSASAPPQEQPRSPGVPEEPFFISFGDESPKKQKPKLGASRKKDEKKTKSGGSTENIAQPGAAKVVTPTKAPLSPPHPPVHVSPGVGFVIGDEDEETGASPKVDVVEKKKQELMEKHKKRRQEQEKNRKKKKVPTATLR